MYKINTVIIKMERDQNGELVRIVEFTVRNDKYRGIVIEKFTTEINEFFFKYQDQAIHRHCEQIQKIVRAADVKRSKKIRIDVSKFSYEYFQNDKAVFKGSRLNSVNDQIVSVCEMSINKEIGALKRSVTVTQNKGRKAEEHNAKVTSQLKFADQYYQQHRARRMFEVFGGNNPGTSQGSGAQGAEIREVQMERPVGAVRPLVPEQQDQQQQENINASIDMELPDDDDDL